ncbi:MAG: citramalate synthase [Chloroflexi bacterium]|nr:citramalate synthase [Chloroflexota bacterium]MQF99685.1 citramalate synthase [SAR202 cluster bacterium]|tara:strand:+ start:429 stop:2012 length:1584 start_codon:yes stop_codon:yes gene_type:complete
MTVKLYDTTLRDGAQQEGISLSVDDKLKITRRLDDLGIHYIEGGIPGSNPKDVEYFKRVSKLSLANSLVSAFGLTRRANGGAATDEGISLLLAADTPVVTLVGKSHSAQVINVLETTLQENLAMLSDSISYLKSKGRVVFFDAEHFFDGFKSDKEYAMQSLRVAIEAGADSVALCDTNGGMLPADIDSIVKAVRQETSADIGIHCHNDADMAVANTIAAVQAGVSHVQGTINGYGERCGNANLISIVANLKLKMGIDCMSSSQLSSLTQTSYYIGEIVNVHPNNSQPYVGTRAFTHKGGIHVAAINKMEESYQHVDPSVIGNTKSVVISEVSGRGNIQYTLKEMGLENLIDRDQVGELLEKIKVQESKGFQYDGAEASFELMVRRHIEGYVPPFTLVDFLVLVENQRRSPQDQGEGDMLAEAMVKVEVGNSLMHTVAEGNGPVNALSNALNKSLLEYYPSLVEMRLVDYKVRVVDSGQDTSATVRVLIESTDGLHRWNTVGASGNIIEASWQALSDSVEYFLVMKND